MTSTPTPTIDSSHLRAAFGPGYQVPLDHARVARALRSGPPRRR